MATTRAFQDPPILDEVIDKEGRFSTGWEEWLFDLTKAQKEIVVIDVRIDPASIPANSGNVQSWTITQVVDEDGNIITIPTDVILFEEVDHLLQIIPPSMWTGLAFAQARISGINRISQSIINNTAAARDPSEETYTLIVLKG